LNRFVDAVRPESEPVRRLERAARSDSPEARAELRVTLTAWAEHDTRLHPKGELAGLSKNLSVLGSMGLRTLEYLDAGNAPPEGWIGRQLAALSDMEKPDAEVKLAAVRPVRILLESAEQRYRSAGNK
jgi:hypothetical protein